VTYGAVGSDLYTTRGFGIYPSTSQATFDVPSDRFGQKCHNISYSLLLCRLFRMVSKLLAVLLRVASGSPAPNDETVAKER